jgi:hypothetical protein
LDLRRKPSAYQKRVISRFKDVVTGRAAVVKPKNAASYKSLFMVIKDKVIVPRHKGEKIAITKRGVIVTERKIGRRKVRSYFRRIKRGEEIPKSLKRKMYFVPFIRGKDAFGKPILDWKRFPDLAMLKQFMEGYDYKDWTDYVIEEDINVDEPYTNSEYLTARLNKKIGKRRKKIRFKDDTDEE